MAYSNPQQRVFLAPSPETPCHPSNGYEVKGGDNSPVSHATASVLLSTKFDALVGVSISNNGQERKMPQDPGFIGSCASATSEKRRKSVNVSKFPSRRSPRIERRKSLCVEGDISSHNKLDDINAGVNGSQSEQVAESLIQVTHEGRLALAQTLELLVIDVVGLSLPEQDQDEQTSNTIIDLEEGESTRKRKKMTKSKSVFESLDLIEKENSSDNDKVKSKSRKKRRDTFDLSQRRGLMRSGAIESSYNCELDLNLISDEADLKPRASSSDADQAYDIITPKNSSNEVQLTRATFDNEISEALSDDEPKNKFMESPAVKENLRLLTSIAIEEKMRSIFPEFSVYNYPCVSARIFAAMSIVFKEREDFDQLLPFLQSLINAEMVSLKSRTQSNEVYFINRKVCFSGFDYSATITARDDIDGSHIDLNSSIAALENVLRQAQSIPRASYYLDVAIQCLYEMSLCDSVNEACSKTVAGFFPRSRLAKAIQHYLLEFQDIKRHISSVYATKKNDAGVRYRLGDFISRSIRFHLRQLLNTIPENALQFNVTNCEERWGHAVNDRSISSIFNFALEKIHEMMTNHEQLFAQEASSPPLFNSKTSEDVVSMPRKQIRNMPEKMFEELINDVKEARSFLLGIRACRFVWELLAREGVDDHVKALEGWRPIESVAKTFYDLNIHECSDNKHYVLLRSIDDLLETVGVPILNLEVEVEKAELYIQKLRKKLQPKKRESSYMVKGSNIYNLVWCLHAEMQEHFPQCFTPLKDINLVK